MTAYDAIHMDPAIVAEMRRQLKTGEWTPSWREKTDAERQATDAYRQGLKA